MLTLVTFVDNYIATVNIRRPRTLSSHQAQEILPCYPRLTLLPRLPLCSSLVSPRLPMGPIPANALEPAIPSAKPPPAAATPSAPPCRLPGPRQSARAAPPSQTTDRRLRRERYRALRPEPPACRPRRRGPHRSGPGGRRAPALRVIHARWPGLCKRKGQLFRVRGVDSVAWAVPSYKGLASAKATDATFRQCVLSLR